MDTIILLNLGVALVMAIQVNFYFNSVLGKESSKPSKWIYMIVFLVINAVYMTLHFPTLLSSALALGVIFCLSMGYEAELKLKVVFSVLYAVLFTLVDFICLYLLDPTISITEESFHWAKGPSPLLFSTSLLLSCTIMFAIVLIIRFLARRKRYPLNFRYYLLFISVPLISIYQVNVLSAYSEKNIHYFLSVFGYVVLNVLVVYILDTVIARFQLLHENAQLEQQMDYQDANYEKTVHSFKKIKSIIHDTNQQFLYVAECIERGRTDEAKEHIRVTLNKIEEAYHRVNTGHLVIDALVTNALNIGQANGIRIDTELRLQHGRELGIDRYDLCVVLGNMLDNALEASKKVRVAEDRHIRIHIRSSESALFLRIRNSVDREVPHLRSRKENPDYHGFGLMNIERICDKYGGHMTIETESLTFDNMVVLPFGSKVSLA
ncbi:MULTISPECIES: ATP-binding protein [Paenibacillus]|uniref:ATP-binding protein n=1 Tax=Paenibacillus campinasensis TaxID=66347 RepID=A0A268EE25_9BACL|nr:MULTISPECIES: ATP-binding protein [Paenibacillus]PAD71361.1 ATP-binding protein [Paenibacillus campinasensis]PAK50636.1 ATP-binding protein [Paenibacillus sp. 7541]